MPTGIPYCDETWNPVTGCTKVSTGCKHCYAEGIHRRFWGDFGDVQCHPNRLDKPLRWRKPRRVLVPSMGDLFHEHVDVAFIKRVYATMGATPQHTYLVTTKRGWRRKWLYDQGSISGAHNVIEGVSVEDQASADERMPVLLATPAVRRWLSVEPLLGPVDILPLLSEAPRLHWVAIGCESGQKRRPCNPEWVRGVVEDCDRAGIPVFVKQLDLDGVVHHNPDEWPAWAQRRELP